MDRTEFEALKREADSGNSEAQYQLGMEYQKKNSGAEPNPALAKHYLQKAADQGHQEARYEYGRILENEADFLGAFEQFQKLPSTHIGARLHVARLLKKGKGVPRNYEEAARLFKSVADEDNNSFAQYQYGDCLKKGLGVPRNLEEAEKYFKEAAKGGSVVGLVGYAELLEQRGESKTAYDLYCKAANDGSTTAMYHIGKCLKRGSGVEEDPVEAAQWFKKAADHGIPESQLKYAECLASGFGVEKNPVEAARLFKQVAKHGNHKAELKYAECLASGAGVEKNPVEGAELFRKAAEGGVAEAAIRYSECLKYGIGVPKNPEEAGKWFNRAIEVGSGKWLYKMSTRLMTGDGVKKNVKGAREALVAAVDRGVAEAMVEYGKICGAGVGVKQDPQKAAELYRQAGVKNDANGLCRYAICLEYGNGVEKDLKKAEEMYLEASKSNGDACFFYGRMQERKGDVKEALKWYQRAYELRSPFGMIYYGTYMDNGVMGVPMSDVNVVALFDEAEKCLMERFVSQDPELQLVIDEARRLHKRHTDNSVSDFIMDPESIELQKDIGHGQYGKVCIAKHKETGELWAAKVMKTSESTAMSDTSLTLREVSMLAMLDHPCILTIKGVTLPSPSSHDWVIATEFMENDSIGRLLQKVNSARAQKEKEPEAWNHTNITIMIVGIVLGMRHIHRLSVLHRDLKPSNILLDKQYHPRIGDFGLSRLYDGVSTLTHEVGTPAYMAPELFENDAYSDKIDVFSFGLILFELLTGQRAFNEERVYAHIKQLVEGKRPEIPDTVSPSMQSLIKECWDNHPEMRPPFAEIYRRLRNIDFKIWDDVDSKAVTDYVTEITNAEREIRLFNIFKGKESW